MDSGRFETFTDAILAIMMTVMVLKIPQPETMTFEGIWELRVMYFAYIVSFIVIFAIWDHHRQLFNIVTSINDRVIWMYAVLIFLITLVPYFTAWVAHEPYALIPELMYGLIFLLVNIFFIITTRVTIKNDVHNYEIQDLHFNEVFLLNVVLFVIGAVISFLGYPIAMLIICLVTVITWNTIPYLQNKYVIGDDSGN